MVDSTFTDYRDGKLWAYIEKKGFIVGLTCYYLRDDYGKFYQIRIYIKNQSTAPVTFWPDSISSKVLTNKDKIIQLEIYTNDEFQKKMRRAQAWAMALSGVSAGLNAGTAGHSTSYTTTYVNGYAQTTMVHHYNPVASYQAQTAANIQMTLMGQGMKQDRMIREQGYLKTTTIYPGEAIIGYMNIKRKKGKVLTVHIPINGNIYSFDWDVSKTKKK